MRRLSLSTKLFAAAMPLLLAVVALLVVTVRSDLAEVDRAERGAELGAVWNPLIEALTAIEQEVVESANISSDVLANGEIAAGRRATDDAINRVRDASTGLVAVEAASKHITASRSALSTARRNLDLESIAPEMQADSDPYVSYDIASRELVAVGQLLPAESDDSTLGQELLAVVKLAEAKLAANVVTANMTQWPNPEGDRTPLAQARRSFTELKSALGEFEAIAPDDWASEYRKSGFVVQLAAYEASLDSIIRAAERGEVETFDTVGFAQLIDQGVEFQREISASIVERSEAMAAETRESTLMRIGVILTAVLVASLIAWLITRSVTRRIKAVAVGANSVARDQLPALVEALRDPRGRAVLPDIEPVNAKGGDELAELADAFNSMQGTLVDVAQEQVEVLRRGVSEIFVTMARRNRSLIDRQLAMLDEFEAEVEDADVLSNYYQLDHMATRMRRNSESLLVLANAEPKRRRVKATEIDDVVRAAIGEVEDYRRVEVEALESLQVRGNVVADIAHMLAELLDNATSFSPPDSVVRVGGRRAGDSYMIRIVDSGVGVGPERMRELNELLREPPVVGLSVEPTLGMSVVSLLANKHGISVTLSAGSPGLTVDVVLPAALFGPIDAPISDGPAVGAGVGTAASTFDETLTPTGMHGLAALAVDETFSFTGVDEPASPRIIEIDDEPSPVAAADWSKMSLNLSAFTSGQRSAANGSHGAESVAESFAGSFAAPVDDAIFTPADELVATRSLDEPDEATAGATWAALELDADAVVDGVVDAVVDADAVVEVDADADADVEVDADQLPPPAGAPLRSEFDRPPAPPMSTDGLARRPVAPETATPAPALRPADAGPSLPTRSPGRGPDGGPDRLTELPSPATPSASTTDAPSALSAALSAFDIGRRSEAPPVLAAPAELPSRVRVGDPIEQASYDEPLATSQSRLDPDALRERLRAFQTEFRTGLNNGDADADHNQDLNTNADLGGDRR